MAKLEIEIDDYPYIDTLTGKTTQKAVCLRSDLGQIYMALETVKEINHFLIEHGIAVI